MQMITVLIQHSINYRLVENANTNENDSQLQRGGGGKIPRVTSEGKEGNTNFIFIFKIPIIR